MLPADFLRKKAETPLCETYLAAGAVCVVSTNFNPILDAARTSFIRMREPQPVTDFRLRFWVDTAAQSCPPWPKPYFRGMDHLVFTGFDSASSLLIDLRSRRAIGRLSPAMGADRDYWSRVIFPSLVTVLGGSVGITSLHCACLEHHGRGLLLAGNSGSGKSTLTLALAQAGLGFVSDDWTYFSRRDAQVLAWGLATALKLRPEAAAYFPELAGREPSTTISGELAFEFDPERQFSLRRSRCCQPAWLIFLERHASHECRLTEVSSDEAAARLEKDLLAEVPDAMISKLETIRKLVERPCWLLQYGGMPQAVARALTDFCQRA